MSRPPELLKSDGAKLKIWPDGPEWDGAPTATIGGFSCKSQAEGEALLKEALIRLRGLGASRVLGPMDGDTWHSYRYVCESDGSKPFLMEPDDKPRERAALRAVGFAPLARYVSARMALRPSPAPPNPDLAITCWDGHDPEALFAQVHELSTRAFAKNAFYKPISRADFLAMYMPMVPMIRPELIVFARRGDGRLAGFLFAVPDYAQGPASRTVILKTYASEAPGAGRLMVHRAQSTALELGFDTVIHALIHEDNLSARNSAAEGADVFRRYELLGLRLDG